MKKRKINNSNLSFDIEKINDFDAEIEISKDYDLNLEYPFIIDVADTGYFYSSENERNEDFELLKTIVPQHTFI